MDNYISGIKYALIFMLVAAVMGVLYGLISGVIIKPALFSITLLGVFVSVNLLFAIIAMVPFLVMKIAKRQTTKISRYIGLSFGFFTVFFPFFILLRFTPISF